MLRPFAVRRRARHVTFPRLRYRRVGDGRFVGFLQRLANILVETNCRGVGMSIETLILVLIVTLAAGFALNWWDAKRNP
jgi:hypothetical protein